MNSSSGNFIIDKCWEQLNATPKPSNEQATELYRLIEIEQDRLERERNHEREERDRKDDLDREEREKDRKERERKDDLDRKEREKDRKERERFWKIFFDKFFSKIGVTFSPPVSPPIFYICIYVFNPYFIFFLRQSSSVDCSKSSGSLEPQVQQPYLTGSPSVFHLESSSSVLQSNYVFPMEME